MTKLRSPDSVEDAVKQAGALLGDEVIALALSNPMLGVTVSKSLVEKWSNSEAPQRIGLHQALAIEALLIKTGHEPIFAELFERLKPRDAQPDGDADPVHAAMHTTRDAALLMDKVDRAMVDGRLSPHEIVQLRAATSVLQKRIARFRRSLVARPASAPSSTRSRS